jgi:hypothetical protein
MKATVARLLIAASLCSAQGLDRALDAFLMADSPGDATRAIVGIEAQRPSFEQVWGRLREGRRYGARAAGVVQAKVRVNGVDHFYSVNVPANYDPAKRYPVRFQLHGGVGGRADGKARGTGEIGALAGADNQFYVLPYAWDARPWWGNDQVAALAAMVDALKRSYNIDENRVHLSGVSDGGTGAYFIAMRDTTPYASFLPLNGFLMVLGNDEIDDGRIYPGNLRNKPMFAINGGLDRLYPTRVVEPYTRYLLKQGVAIDYHPQPNGEHNTRWWPEMKATFEQFVATHLRTPHPDRISWEASDAQHNRAHWLVIDKYGAARGERALQDMNTIPQDEKFLFDATGGVLFSRGTNTGRVDVERRGNTVEAATQGVTQFTLLISPDQFQLDQPIRVVADGREVFNARVQADVKTLLKWAARDNDRTMLYAAEIVISLR